MPELETTRTMDAPPEQQSEQQPAQRSFIDRPGSDNKKKERATLNSVMSKMDQRLMRMMPGFETHNAMALTLAKRTPALMAICLSVILACVIASLLHFSQADFLWGIPALGFMGLGFGVWVWSSSLLKQPGLTDEARAALRRAIRLQYALLAVSVLAVLHFVAIAAGLW